MYFSPFCTIFSAHRCCFELSGFSPPHIFSFFLFSDFEFFHGCFSFGSFVFFDFSFFAFELSQFVSLTFESSDFAPLFFSHLLVLFLDSLLLDDLISLPLDPDEIFVPFPTFSLSLSTIVFLHYIAIVHTLYTDFVFFAFLLSYLTSRTPV